MGDEPIPPLPLSVSTEGVVAHDLGTGEVKWYVDVCPETKADTVSPTECGDVEVIATEGLAIVSVLGEIKVLDASSGNTMASRDLETGHVRLVDVAGDGLALFVDYGTGESVEIARLNLTGLAS